MPVCVSSGARAGGCGQNIALRRSCVRARRRRGADMAVSGPGCKSSRAVGFGRTVQRVRVSYRILQRAVAGRSGRWGAAAAGVGKVVAACAPRAAWFVMVDRCSVWPAAPAFALCRCGSWRCNQIHLCYFYTNAWRRACQSLPTHFFHNSRGAGAGRPALPGTCRHGIIPVRAAPAADRGEGHA